MYIHFLHTGDLFIVFFHLRDMNSCHICIFINSITSLLFYTNLRVPVEGALLFLLVVSPCLSPSTGPSLVMLQLTACVIELWVVQYDIMYYFILRRYLMVLYLLNGFICHNNNKISFWFYKTNIHTLNLKHAMPNDGASDKNWKLSEHWFNYFAQA